MCRTIDLYAGQPAWPVQQAAQPPVAPGGLGDLPPIPRPQQAVDPAVMQFYMQQPQHPTTMGFQQAIPNFLPAAQMQAPKDQEAAVSPKPEPHNDQRP